ncbi:hypothetical protein GQ43DRAFT_432649 [Delitschia confertaspora ATCC 74209]|uniref:Nuclear pore complex protein Nup85 n=1 Tax=Delitschia confertaspora ATCC 74209 TaxID=1513339 RepID=A0A9P4JJ13_9PLEO|nr:hypothetical protein GQ43DRAFT_432649 [Delitschia confertaspora ATCC 74209]
MVFRVPSSTPPSTPDSRRSSRHNAPSTTPAGPPPSRSLIASSTPAGPPPNGFFGSSQFDPAPGSSPPKGNPLFGVGSSPVKGNPLFGVGSSPQKGNTLFGVGSGHFGVPTSARPPTRGRALFRAPDSSPPRPYAEDDAYEEEEEEEGEEEDEEYGSEEDADEEQDETMEDDEGDYGDEEGVNEEDEDEDYSDEEEDTGYGNKTLGKRPVNRFGTSRNRKLIEKAPGTTIVRAEAKQSQYDLLKLAKGLTFNTKQTTLRESDEMVLETERLMGKLHDSMVSDTLEKRTEVLEEVAQGLVTLWRAASPLPLKASVPSMGRPGAGSPISNANRLGSLLIEIHHPGPLNVHQGASAFSLVSSRRDSRHTRPVPKVLIDWLNNYHLDTTEVDQVLKEQRGYSAHSRFWDAVSSCVLRGDFAAAIKLLKGAKFEVAETAAADGLGNIGYKGAHLDNINDVVDTAIDIIQTCPAVESEDWEITGPDWSVYRGRVTQALLDLQNFAEGNSVTRNSTYQPFGTFNFGASQSQGMLGLSMASRKAESTVPWSVYQSLSKIYRQLLGGEEETVSSALDWVEAVLGLVIWWDGEDDDIPQGSLAASRRSLARSHRARAVDMTPTQAYSRRLSAALATVLSSEEGFTINETDPSEVGLACIFDDNTEGTLQILRSWSLVMASAAAEVASCGEWFRRADGILDQFDQSDLMVLSFNEEQRSGLTKDDILTAYANVLSAKDTITNQDQSKEGWELAMQILARLDDERGANDRIVKLLDDLPLHSSDRVDKALTLCNELGLQQHASRIAAKYADHLSKNSQNYGDTLVYYARAHDATKVKEVIQILVSHCLIKSISYPPIAQLDERLKTLITAPKATLTQLAKTDLEAAKLLSTHLSGYATIRKFYDLRDEEIIAESSGEKPKHRPVDRKRAAAAALMVIIKSAASSIRGGLYDPEVETVVQVDNLLSLLGEALVFVNQKRRTLKTSDLYSLLAAVTDLETAPSLIYAQCEECFSSTLAAAHGGVQSPHATMNKSTSNLTTASSQFSLIGSTDLGGGSVEGRSTDSSTVLVQGGKVNDAKRAWDWRKGFGKDAKGEDVILVLRLGISQEMGRAWTEGEF